MAKLTKLSKKVSHADDSSREEVLNIALLQIEKQFGKGAIMRLGARGTVKISVISTHSPSLDIALGVGGLPRGRIVEIYGQESSGKTTLALHTVAEAQKVGGIAAFIDAEHALDPIYAKQLGVDTENLLVSQPDTGEQALDICELLVRSGAVDIIVIDSVAALVPAAEIEGAMGDSHVGLQARLMSQALRKLTATISKSKSCVVFINQLREKIGVMYGPSDVTTGGKALKFYATVRLDIRKKGGGVIKDGDQIIGNRTVVKVAKNKVSPPFKLAEFDIIYGKGINRNGDFLDLAVDKDIVCKSGTWYSYGDTRIGQGRNRSLVFLEENPDVLSEIEEKVYIAYGLKEDPAAAEAEAAEKPPVPAESDK